VWAHEGQIVAVQPHDAFLPYFEAADGSLQHRCETIGAEGGSDGDSNPARTPHWDSDVAIPQDTAITTWSTPQILSQMQDSALPWVL